MNTRSEPGAPAGSGFIPLSVPEIAGNEWKYIKECLDTNWVSSAGPFVDRFERDIAAYLGVRHAVACSTGTAALHVALLVAGVRPDDEVLVSDLTFIAPANAVRYCGAWPVFIDAEPDYWQMDVKEVEKFLVHGCRFDGRELRNKATGRRVKAILPVHILGHPCDMDSLMELARRFNLVVVEDATESLGAKYRTKIQRPEVRGQRSEESRSGDDGSAWRMVGSLGHIGCLSFNGNKIMTTGGGGMIVTDNEAWANKARYLTTQAKDDPVEYVHNEIGFNYRLTNMQAAMGCGQLERLDHYIAAKRSHAAAYNEAFRNVDGISPMRESPDVFSVYWMYTVLVDPSVFGLSSRDLLRKLDNARIQTRPLWQPIHLSRAYTASAPRPCPVAERLNQRALSLPCSVGLTSEQQGRVIERIIGARGKP